MHECPVDQQSALRVQSGDLSLCHKWGMIYAAVKTPI